MILDLFLKHRIETMDHPTRAILQTVWAKVSASYHRKTRRSLDEDLKSTPKTTDGLFTQLAHKKSTFEEFRSTRRDKYDRLKKASVVIERLCLPVGTWINPFGRATFGLLAYVLQGFSNLSQQYDTIGHLLDRTVVRMFSSSLAYWCLFITGND
jgi:hypothetical protein